MLKIKFEDYEKGIVPNYIKIEQETVNAESIITEPIKAFVVFLRAFGYCEESIRDFIKVDDLKW